MYKKYLFAGIFSGILFLVIDQPMLLLFSLFLITLSFQNKLQAFNNKINIPIIIKLIILMIFIGFLTEIFAIWNNSYLTPEQIMGTNKLFSADPITDIVLGWGYYIPLAIVWYFLLNKYNYNTKDVFISMGLFGIVFEGKGLILLSLNPILWAYAFVVHGSYVAIAQIITKNDPMLKNKKQKQISRIKKYFYGFIFSLLTFIPFVLWEITIKSFS